MKTIVVSEKAKAARKAFLEMAGLTSEDKNKALLAIADSIEKNRNKIVEANSKDVEAAVNDSKLNDSMLARLRLSEEKMDAIVDSVESVAGLEDPVGRTIEAKELDKDLNLYKVSTPLGVIGFIFESRPDVLPQIASLCLKSGNSVLLKGGSEARNTNQVMYNVIKEASEDSGIPGGWIQLVEGREDVAELLKLDECIDLMIPRGSKSLVKYIQENTRIPVLGHTDGICHVYVDRDADLEKAINVCLDSKVQYPGVCNAMETLLVDEKIAKDFLPNMADEYVKAGVEMRLDDGSWNILESKEVKTMLALNPEVSEVKIEKAVEADWTAEYNNLTLSIKIVEGVEEAVEHINYYGSHHTDAILTENQETAKKFLQKVDSSSVMHNCSTRFADGYRYGLGAEVGISTNKTHARGPVGLKGLVIYKWILQGSGQTVAQYTGKNARIYTHKKTDKKFA